ncbi:MAG: hypothetical protein ACPG5T_10995, partial [Endozoicomonas sp.]
LDTQWEFHEQVKAVCPNILRLNDPADVERSGVNQANLNRLEKVRNDMQAKYHWVPDINAILLDRVGLSLLCDGDYAPTSDELKDILLGYIKAAILTKVPSSMVLDVRKRLQASVISQDSKDLILKIFNGWDNIEKARNNMRVYYEWLPSIDAVLPPVKALMNSHFSKQTDNARLVADVTGGCKKHVRDETYKRLPADFPSKLDKQTWQQMMANPSEEEIDMILRSAAPEN